MSRPDFIRSFREWVGETECPDEYLTWGAISLLAAACGDRLYTLRQFGNNDFEVIPNLYMILLGPTGNYKSLTLNRIHRILGETCYRAMMNFRQGRITAAGMVDIMNEVHYQTDAEGKRKKTLKPWNKHLYLLNDELSMCCGSDEFAQLYIRQLTGMYYGEDFDDVTRTHGEVQLRDYTLNWLATSTVDWLIQSIPPDNFEGGFLRRVVLVPSGYTDKVVWRPTKNPRTQVLHDYLVNRIDELLVTGKTAGCIAWTSEADRVAKHWYFAQERTGQSDRVGGSARDQLSLITKLALIFALARHQIRIDDECVADAIEYSNLSIKWKNTLIPKMQRGTKGRAEDELLELIRSRDQMPQHILSKIAYNKFHIKAGELRSLVETWIQSDLIEERKLARSKGGTVYVARNK